VNIKSNIISFKINNKIISRSQILNYMLILILANKIRKELILKKEIQH